MGPSQSKTENISINHPNFKNAEIIFHDQTPYMKTKFVLHNAKNFQEWEKAQKRLDKMDETYLLLPIDHKVEKNAFCGPSAVVNIVYENYPIILADEIENRKNYQQHFQEVEVWYLLHILISTSSFFHQQATKLGDIRPQNIFVNKQGQIKLANVFSWPSIENNYLKSLTQNEITFIAPEQLLELSEKRSSPQSNPYKAQSFSIGLTLLGVMLLEDCSKLYQTTNCTFDDKSLQNLLGRLNAQKLYSSFLRSIVVSLLDMNPQTRKSSQEVYQIIKPYEYQMENLIQFQYQNPGQKNQVGSSVVRSDYRQSVQRQSAAGSNQHPQIFNLDQKYNYTSNLPTHNNSQKNKLNFNQENYLTAQKSNTFAESQKTVPPLLPNIETTNKFPQLPNYTSNTYTNYQSSLNYTPKTLEEIYNSINIKQLSNSKLNNNINNSPLASSYNQQSHIIERTTFPSFNKNYEPLKPIEPISPSLNSGSKTPATIPWQDVDKYIQMSRQLYK